MSRVLLDSNIVIYSLDPKDVVSRPFIAKHRVACSAISRVETLGYARITLAEIADFRAFFDRVRSYPVDDAMIDQAAALKRRRNVKLGDAIIAATAIVHGLTLATRNAKDFDWIEELSVVNPYDDSQSATSR